MQALYIFFHFYGMRVLKQNCVTNILPELKMPSGIIVHVQKYKQIQICADKNKSQDLEHLMYLQDPSDVPRYMRYKECICELFR